MLSLWSLPPFKYQNHETLWTDGPWWMSEWRGSVGIDMIPKWDIIQRKWGLNTACHSDLASRLPRAAGKGLLFPHMQQWRQAVWMTAQCQSLFLGDREWTQHAWNTTVGTCWEVCKTQYAKSSPVCFAGAAAGFSMPMRLEHLQGCRCNKLICHVLIPDWFPEFSEGRRMTCSWKKSTICARCWQTAMKRSESRCQHRHIVLLSRPTWSSVVAKPSLKGGHHPRRGGRETTCHWRVAKPNLCRGAESEIQLRSLCLDRRCMSARGFHWQISAPMSTIQGQQLVSDCCKPPQYWTNSTFSRPHCRRWSTRVRHS